MTEELKPTYKGFENSTHRYSNGFWGACENNCGSHVTPPGKGIPSETIAPPGVDPYGACPKVRPQ